MSPPIAPHATATATAAPLRLIHGAPAPARPPSPLRALRRELRGMERYEPPFADRSVVNLSLNEHPAPPSPEVRAALQSAPAELLVTYDTERAARLRERIAARDGVRPDNVLLCTGSSHALQLLFGCLGTTGTALLPSICWSYYATLARLHGMPVAHYPLAPHGNSFQVDLEAVLRALDGEDPSLAVFINPHMPTGALTPADALVACVAHARGSLVLVDEAYHGFSREAPTLTRHVLDHDNLVVARTFSKFFGLAGLRVGYLIAHTRMIAQLTKALPPFGVPGIASLVALAVLDSEPYYRARADELMAIKDAFCRRLAARPRLAPRDSHGNFLLIELPDAEQARAAEARLHHAGVAVRSARSYGMPAFLRISVGTAETMDLVARLLEDLHGA